MSYIYNYIILLRNNHKSIDIYNPSNSTPIENNAKLNTSKLETHKKRL